MFFIIVPVVIVLLIIVIVAAVLIIVIVVWWRKKARKKESQTSHFEMGRSNVSFTPLRGSTALVVNKTVMDFQFDFDSFTSIPVEQESRDILCVGNNGRHTAKVQFTWQENEKYSLRVEPKLMVLKRGFAGEFEVFITPHCSCKTEETISIVSVDLQRGQENVSEFRLKVETEQTSKLHYDDVACEKQIGEGSFGVVFKGTFRGNDVAIKKMKEVGVSADSLDEFAKEVAMLDKFRCDQIVHFYGACFIPNHIMMVTEFAPCGSLADCIVKRPEPSEQIKAKLMLDAAKGLEYLHANGVLHRDIKPDNVLVFSLDEVLNVNGKLTDFGSSRNINMLMTNMTFTKGIGTPKYMAPEVLNQEKYKKSADVFSFGVMLFECFKWGDAYPKALFKYPWDIVTFVTSGQRLAQPETMQDDVYRITQLCWSQHAVDRIGFPCARLTPRCVFPCCCL